MREVFVEDGVKTGLVLCAHPAEIEQLGTKRESPIRKIRTHHFSVSLVHGSTRPRRAILATERPLPVGTCPPKLHIIVVTPNRQL